MNQKHLLIFSFLFLGYLSAQVIKPEDAICTLIPIAPNKASVSGDEYLTIAAQTGTNICLPIKVGHPKKPYHIHMRANEIALSHFDQTSEKYITVIARGFAGREKLPPYLRAVKSGLGFIGNNIIHNTCITFEFPDNFATFGFHPEANPLMRIRHFIPESVKTTLLGDCRGAVLSLEASMEMPNADSIILISGFISVEELTRQMAKSYLGSTRMAPIIRKIMKTACPRFNTHEDRFKHTLRNLKNKKILLCHCKNDHMVSRKNIIDLVNAIKEHNEVYLMILDEPHAKHSRLVHLASVQQCINAFLKISDRPHCQDLAHKGIETLAQAKLHARYPERYV